MKFVDIITDTLILIWDISLPFVDYSIAMPEEEKQNKWTFHRVLEELKIFVMVKEDGHKLISWKWLLGTSWNEQKTDFWFPREHCLAGCFLPIPPPPTTPPTNHAVSFINRHSIGQGNAQKASWKTVLIDISYPILFPQDLRASEHSAASCFLFDVYQDNKNIIIW